MKSRVVDVLVCSVGGRTLVRGQSVHIAFSAHSAISASFAASGGLVVLLCAV